MAKVSIAICGGGIGGVTLANALSKLDNITFDLYEAAPQVAGSGLGVGLNQNAQRAMTLIGPEVRRALDDAGSVTMDPTVQVRMGNGPDFGRPLVTFGEDFSSEQVERAALLDALCRNVAAERLHAGKKMHTITHDGSRYTLAFEDGTTTTADAIIGFDGIHSTVRKYILGNAHPAAGPVFSGICSYWGTVPIERATKILGVEQIANSQYCWYGKDGYLLYNLMSEGKSLMVAGCKPGVQWTDNPWVKQRTLDEVKQDFADWGDLGERMAQLFVDPTSEKAMMIAFWDHPDAPTYFKDAVCMAGDAAHSMVPFQGAGAGQAIEDALVLSRVLAQVKSPEDLPAAFAGYDHVRRPRSQSIVATSRKMGMMGLGRDENHGDYEKMKAALPTAWDHILFIDTEAHCKEAVQQMLQVKARGK